MVGWLHASQELSLRVTVLTVQTHQGPSGPPTIEGRTFEGPIWLLHHHDVDGTSHMRCQAIHSTQDGGAPHHHPTLWQVHMHTHWGDQGI